MTAIKEKPGLALGGEVEIGGITYAVHDHLFGETWSEDGSIFHRAVVAARAQHHRDPLPHRRRGDSTDCSHGSAIMIATHHNH